MSDCFVPPPALPHRKTGSPPVLVNLPACLLEQFSEAGRFLTIGVQAILSSETKLRGREDSETEEVKPSPYTTLPFQAFQRLIWPSTCPCKQTVNYT